MARMVLPAALRSATAVPGKSDLRDENIYSSFVAQHGGIGTAKLFTVPQGQNIPRLAGAAITASTQVHHGVYSLLTTVLEKAGELGNNIGDAGVRAIGVTIEAQPVANNATYPGALVLGAYGAGPAESAEIMNKTVLELKVSNKRQIVGPVWSFPQTGGFAFAPGFSGTFTAGQGGVFGTAQTANLPLGRKLKVPIMVARNDVLVAEMTSTAAYVFTQTTSPGQPALVWVNLVSTIKGDVR